MSKRTEEQILAELQFEQQLKERFRRSVSASYREVDYWLAEYDATDANIRALRVELERVRRVSAGASS